MKKNARKVMRAVKRGRKVIGGVLVVLPIVIMLAILISAYRLGTGNNSDASKTAALLASAKGGFATPGQYRAAIAVVMAQQLYGTQAEQYHSSDPVFTSALAYWKETCRTANGSLCHDAQSGSLQCVEFVSGVFATTDNDLPAIGQANQFWNLYQREPGWQEIAPSAFLGQGGPEAGDIMAWSGGQYGHIAIVIASKPPQGNSAGFITVAQAAATLSLMNLTWSPSGSITSWSGYKLQGIIRQAWLAPCLLSATVQQQHWEALAEQAAVHFGIPSLAFLRQICLASAFQEANNPVSSASDEAPVGIAQLDTLQAAQISRCVVDLTQSPDCANRPGARGIDPTNPQEALPAAASVMARLYLHYLNTGHATTGAAAYEMAVAAYAVGQTTIDQAVHTCASKWLTCLDGMHLAPGQAPYLPPPAELAHYVSTVMQQ